MIKFTIINDHLPPFLKALFPKKFPYFLNHTFLDTFLKDFSELTTKYYLAPKNSINEISIQYNYNSNSCYSMSPQLLTLGTTPKL